jgi:thymidine kinase
MIETGSIRLFLGTMSSGKSGAMLVHASRFESVYWPVLYFKPVTDTRHKHIKSRAGIERQATLVSTWFDLHDIVRIFSFSSPLDERRLPIVVIDEVQFMPADGVKILWQLAQDGYTVLCAGLPNTTELEPFETIHRLLALADEVHWYTALCTICGRTAPFTICTEKKEGPVLVGSEMYQARCRQHVHHNNPNIDKMKENLR